MAAIPAAISHITYDPATNRARFYLASTEEIPPMPPEVRPDLWYPGPRATVSFEVTIPTPNETPQTAVGGVEQADGSIRWYRVTWNGTAWVNPIRVADSDGNPFQAL